MKHKTNLKNIKALLVDVDGILTDGNIWWHSPGEWRRTFNIYDGYGIKALIQAGYTVGIITGSTSEEIRERQMKLGIHYLYEGAEDKIPCYEDFLKNTKFKDSEVAYIGDDLPDIPILKRVGFSASVPTAMEIVKKTASYITKKNGGHGAVREICDMLLATKIKAEPKKLIKKRGKK